MAANTNKVLISILNWNATHDTIRCVQSLSNIALNDNINIQLTVVDNASSSEEFDFLKTSLSNQKLSIFRNETNLGFAGGHNSVIQYAIDNNFDYVWLLNNDAIVYKDTLSELVKFMQNEPKCGSCSPLIKRLDHPEIVDFSGAIHDWPSLSICHPASFEDAPSFCENNLNQLWLVGTALLLRVGALREIGLLNDKLFAYYEDNDIGIRLIKAGWKNRLVFSSVVEHACFDGVITDRKPYYFYLMARNSFLFFLPHTPPPCRRFLRTRLIDNSLAVADNLYRLGFDDKAKACLLGVADGLAGIGGPPLLNRPMPLWLRFLRPIGRWWNRKRQ
jgi:GT2 family glycosyltransferase